MSKRKFLNEINKMTRKGEYPSLKILLEEDDPFEMGSEEESSEEEDD